MTLEEKQDTLRNFGTAISIAKRLLDDESETISVSVGAWTIERRSGNSTAKPQWKHGRGDLCHED